MSRECAHRFRTFSACPFCRPRDPLALFVVGAPGAGKTTICRALIERLGGVVRWTDKPKWTVLRDACFAGHYFGDVHDGADTIAYNGAAAALAYWDRALRRRTRLTVFDGARFATQPSLDFVLKRARVVGAYVLASEADLARNRAARGTDQDPAWMKGAATRADRFASAIGARPVHAMYGVRESVDEILGMIGEVGR